MAGECGQLYLGLDFSTQQIKCLAIDDSLRVVKEEAVRFDTDLPHYKTHGGVHVHEDKVTITSPTVMWVEALDMLLSKLKAADFPFHQVAAVSGTGQQHGSVFWKQDAHAMLTGLQPDKPMAEQLKEAFSVADSPVWMDASTTAQCKQLEDKVGGAEQLAKITGSRAHERFTGNQIAKIYQQSQDSYNQTERIGLVSSFAASLFIGDYAAIDDSDGSGMNLLDIRKRDWSDSCLDACAPVLRQKLGSVESSLSVAGLISSYMCGRYGFPSTCKVVSFTGDNPGSLAGLAPQAGDVIVSLGTSDTVFLWLKTPTPKPEGHIFVNPVVSTDFMALLCFKNGSLTRERIRDEKSGGSWDRFNEQLQTTSMGNNGNVGIYFDVTEIQPFVQGVYRFDQNGKQVDSFPDAVEVRAVIESQCMSRRVHAENLGFDIGPNTRVIATGGASSNQGILQVIADVFNAKVYIQDVANSAALGAAYRAKNGTLGDDIAFWQMVGSSKESVCVASPTPGAKQIYTPLCQRYRQLEEMLQKEHGQC